MSAPTPYERLYSDRVRRQMGELLWGDRQVSWSEVLDAYPEAQRLSATTFDAMVCGYYAGSLVYSINTIVARVEALLAVLRKYPDDTLNILTEAP